MPEAERLAEAEADLAAERANFEVRWGEGVPAPTGAAAEVRGELTALQSGIERVDLESSRLRSRLAALTEKAQRLAVEAPALRGVTAPEAADPLGQRSRSGRGRAHRRPKTPRSGAEAELRAAGADRWRGRRAPTRSPARSTMRGRVPVPSASPASTACSARCSIWSTSTPVGRRRSKRPSVPRSVRSWWPAAPAGARRALRREGEGGAVPRARRARPGADPAAAGRRGGAGTCARRAARSSACSTPLLAGAVSVDGDWTAALDASLAHPDAVIVTRAGDRFATTGWRVGAGRRGATGAALDEAPRRAAGAARGSRRIATDARRCGGRRPAGRGRAHARPRRQPQRAVVGHRRARSHRRRGRRRHR